jgi:hypothetical protein
MGNAIDALVEIFTWVGFGLGALVAGVALIAYLADGTWLPVRAVVEEVDGGRVVRWFDADGGVNEAPLSDADHRHLGRRDMVDVWARQGSSHRMRLHRRSSFVKALVLFAAGLLAIGTASLVLSLILLFLRG